MRLASPQEVLTLMSVGITTATEATVNLALDLSYPIIESLLDTRIQKTSYVDYFDYGMFRSRYTHPAPTVLWLTSRFLVAGSAVVVRESIDGQPLRAASDGALVDPSDYYVNAETGELTLLRTHAKGLARVSVAYEAGFNDNGSNIDDPAVPSWLHAGAVTAAIHMMNTHPTTPATRKYQTPSTVSTTLRSHLYGLLAPHFRTRSDRLAPARSVVAA